MFLLVRAVWTRAGCRGGEGPGRYRKRVKAEVLGIAPEPSTVMGPDPGGVRYVLVCGYVDPDSDYRDYEIDLVSLW